MNRIKARVADVRLWLARWIVPYGWVVMDEIDVSHYDYLRDKAGEP